jgi:hypothetical protein
VRQVRKMLEVAPHQRTEAAMHRAFRIRLRVRNSRELRRDLAEAAGYLERRRRA